MALMKWCGVLMWFHSFSQISLPAPPYPLTPMPYASIDPSLLSSNLRLAIPKKGRLFEKCESILKGAGLEYRREPRLDVAVCTNLPVTVVFLPAADIASYVGLGDVDLGITGHDVVVESGMSDGGVEVLLKLGFGKVRESISPRLM